MATEKVVAQTDDPISIDDAPEALIEEELKDEPDEELKIKTPASITKEFEPKNVEDNAAEEQEITSGPEELIEEAIEDDVEETEDLVAVPVKTVAREDLFEGDLKDATKKKKGFFGKLKERIVKFKLDDEAFEELFWEFELALLENGVAVEVIDKIKQDLHVALTQENVSRRSVEQIMLDTLKDSLADVLDCETFDLIEKTKEKQPLVICIVGVNGSGKTTTLAKLIKLFQNNNKSLVVAAADTFRAAAIQQLEEHTTKLGVKLIKHDYNADPAAVAFDAVKHATAKKLDVVLIDTAGRLQSNSNLMDELKKVVRINKPDLTLFIGEAITGNDCVEQAVAFNDAVGIDGLILSKADIDEKGGAAISVSFVTKKPILYLGVGQTYDDLVPFDKEKVLESLGL
jgi:fused signal recognition particle receptor